MESGSVENSGSRREEEMAGGDGPTGVRARCQVVVIGDPGTGKSSLIVAVATDSFPEKVPPVLPPTRLPHDFYPDRVPLTIVDTSSRSVGFPLLRLVSLGPRVHVTAVPAPPVAPARPPVWMSQWQSQLSRIRIPINAVDFFKFFACVTMPGTLWLT